MGDYDGAERAFARARAATADADLADLSAAHQGLARVARIRGRLAEAERHTRMDMEVSERRGLPGVVLADAADLARDARGLPRRLGRRAPDPRDRARASIRSIRCRRWTGPAHMSRWSTPSPGAASRPAVSFRRTSPRCPRESVAAGGSGTGRAAGSP